LTVASLTMRNPSIGKIDLRCLARVNWTRYIGNNPSPAPYQ